MFCFMFTAIKNAKAHRKSRRHYLQGGAGPERGMRDSGHMQTASMVFQCFYGIIWNIGL